jgi:hypothetical protein
VRDAFDPRTRVFKPRRAPPAAKVANPAKAR